MERVLALLVKIEAATDTLLVIVKNPADFVGAHLGQSESQTKAILENAVGKVLIIDEVCFFLISLTPADTC